MTIVTKPISEKKTDKLEEPLVENEVNESLPSKVDIEATAEPEPQYFLLRTRARRVSTTTTVCLFLTALLVMSIGIIGGVYLYRQFARSQMHRFRGWCNIPYDAKSAMFLDDNSGHHHSSLLADSDLFKSLTKPVHNGNSEDPRLFKEEFDLDLENEKFEKIDVPDFTGGRRGRFIHDFNANKTGIIDLDGHRCFVMPLNRRQILPPRSLFDLVRKMWSGYYEVDTEVVKETMRVVTPPINDYNYVGYYIARECEGVPTYMLEKVVTSEFKRSIEEGHLKFAEFAGKNILQLDIINTEELEKYEQEHK